MSNNAKVQKFASAAKDNAFALADLAAKGNEAAAFELYRTAALATGWLTDYLCRMKPELFKAIAARKMFWPVMWGAHRDTLKENKKLIDALKLASGTGINFSSDGKTFSWTNPANQIAIYLYQLAQALRRAPIREWDEYEQLQLGSIGRFFGNAVATDRQQLRDLEVWGQRGAGQLLPHLSKDTAGEWEKATPKLFRLVYGKNFDDHPRLQKLKNAVLGRAKNASGKQGGRGVVRKVMLQAVKQAWHSIAALD